MSLDVPLDDALRAAIEHRVDPVWVFDAEHESMVFGNAAACEFWRAESVEELIERDYTTDMSSATRSRLAAVRTALQAGEVVHEQWTFYPASQSPKTVELRAERVDLLDGRLAILFSIERAGRTPEDALRGVEAVRHTTVLITLFDRDGTRALYSNPAALRAYGAGRAWRSLWVSRFVDEDEGLAVLEAVQAGKTLSLETRMRTRQGLRWHGLDARLTVDPVTGDPAILINEKDIQDAKEAEAGLRDAREELEHRVLLRTTELAASRDFVSTVLDTLDALVVVVDGEQRIEWANRVAAAELGEGLVGQARADVPGLPRRGGPTELDLPNARGPRRIHWTVTALDRPSRRTVMTGVDVTEQRALQEQMQLNDRLTSLGTLAAGIAHELNNPFAVVRANLEVIRDGLPAEEAGTDALEGAIRDALAAMERAARIVADLRAYTRVEEGTQALELHPLVEGAVGLAFGALREIDVRIEVPSDLWVLGVEGPLTQVLLNLLINAAQAIEGPDGRVVVRARCEAERVLVSVEDNGPGIDPELAGRLFDPFFTTKPVGEGTGLGLYVCQRIVKAHGGDIRFDTTVAGGARIEVSLPVARADLEQDRRESAFPRASEANILLIDDDRAVLRALKRLLRGHRVDVAVSGEEALAQLLLPEPETDYDMVLCDLMMPGMSGAALYAAVRSQYPARASRIVFMSGGLPYRSSIGEFLESVPNRFLQKPVTRRGIDAALRALGPPVEAD